MLFIFSKILKFFTYFSPNLKTRFINKLFNILNNQDQNFFFTYNYRQKYFIKTKNKKNFNKKTSIIIQGPIVRKHDFTINTINLYLNNCSSKIILSTWEKELSRSEENLLKKKGVQIIKNKIPNFKGPMNLNLQMVSTFEGLKLSKKNKNKFCIKTRTDTRIYLKNFDQKIYNFFYFLKKNNKSIKFGSSSLTIGKRIFGVSDFFMFGQTSDLLNYFDNSNISNDIKNFGKMIKKNRAKKSLFGNVDLIIYPENFLFYNFIKKKINSNIKYSLKSYYKNLKKFFLIIDVSSLDFFWFKYDHQYEYRDKNFGNIKGNKDVNLTFYDWINLD